MLSVTMSILAKIIVLDIVTITMELTTTSIPPAKADRERWLALYVLCTGMLMIVLDATIVNVALPSIQDSPS
jgi:hypothetical protein